jgi:hypothetical protein
MSPSNSPLSRRNFLRLAACGGAGGALGWAGHAQESAVPPPSDTGAEYINKETEAAIDRGLSYLARAQFEDGSYTERSTGASVGIASLCGLALMSGGSQPGRGPHARNVSKVVDYVLAAANGPLPGFLTAPESQSGIRGQSQQQAMYSHGFGCLFLAEVCGMLPDRERQAKVKTTLERAIAILVGAQNTEGGWRYEPKPPPLADVSVTVAQMMAFRAAKNAGVTVRPEVIVNGVKFILDCQLPDGGFSYFKGQGFSAFARTAAAVGGLYSVGSLPDERLSRQVERAIEKGLKYIQSYLPGKQYTFREIPPQHYYYGQYYAGLAMWMAGGEYWPQWFPAIRDELLMRARGPGGSWTDNYYGSAYATAMSLIVLQLPNNYLPILQK